jgi:hypothetical protein
MRIYLAASYHRREELCEHRRQLLALGFNVRARWLDGQHQLDLDGTPIGDQGEKLVEDGSHSKNAALRAKFARDDWDDVTGADIVINFTEPPGSTAARGGRHVECGIALARGTRVIVVGYRENLFHWLPQIEFAESWEQAFRILQNSQPRQKAVSQALRA